MYAFLVFSFDCMPAHACSLRRRLLPALLCVLVLFVSVVAREALGQALPHGLAVPAQVDRVGAHADLTTRTLLVGQRPSFAVPANLTGSKVTGSEPLHLTLVLQRSPAVQRAFEKLLADQQDPASALFHKWLTPAQIGTLYGPTDDDLNAVSAWAVSEGLTVDSIAPSRMFIDLQATTAIVSQALRTSFSYYRVGDSQELAADTDPSLPAALLPVVQAISGLGEVAPVPLSEHHSEHVSPAYTNGSGNHYMAPGDFAVIYDVTPLSTAGNTGAAIGSKAQHIAIIDESDLVPQDIADFAARVGLASYQLNILYPTTDPGTGTSQGESTLDVMRTIGTANGAVTDLVLNASLFTGAQYAVNTLVDPVLTMSWGSCSYNNPSTVTKWDTLWSQAAAEGISVFISAGDSGAAGCDTHGSAAPATQVASTNAFCDSTYATCVGGTEFNDTANPALYWSGSNTSTRTSALSYIPEGVWNDPGTAGAYVVRAGGGGASPYIPKPSWQTGTGVPADGLRDEPDVSFSASSHDGYYGCINLNCESGMFEIFSGTSAAAPGMAAVAALLNTHAGVAQGNLNPILYRLANSPAAASIFHDATVASSGVTGCALSTPSMCNNSTPSTNALTGGLPGFLLTAGYDQATGLGSLDVANFVSAAVPVATTLALTPGSSQITTAQTAVFTTTLTPAGTSVAAPTGTVQFYVNGAALGSAVTLTNNSAVSPALSSRTATTEAITAVYSGDSYYVGSTAPGATLTVTVPPSFTLTPTNANVSFTSGATSGNTDVVTVVSNSFVGTMNLTCAISTSGAAFQPSCTVAPASVTFAAAGTQTASVTISSTAAQASLVRPPWVGESVQLAGLAFGFLAVPLLLGVTGAERRRHLQALRRGAAAICLLCVCTALATGCSGSSGNGTSSGGATTLRSSAGTYTVTVTGAGTNATMTGASASTTFTVTIN